MLKSLWLLITFSLLFILVSPKVYGYQKLVLAAETQNLSMPPTVEGPGLLLPDSPFFFLDRWKQTIRIFFAFTPQGKAQVYSDIAGERLAELRFMLLRQNLDGVTVDLQGIRDNTRAEAQELNSAQLSGFNVQDEARALNLSIKQRLQALDALGLSAKGELQADIKFTTQTLADSKSTIEDSLSPTDLTQEVQYDTQRELLINFQDASTSAMQIQETLIELQKEASQSALQNQTEREEALKIEIASETNALKRANLQEQLSAIEKSNISLQLVGDAEKEASNIVSSAQKAASDYNNSKSN